MDTNSISWSLIYLGLTSVLLELLVGIETGFDLVLIGIALIVGGGVGNWTGSWELGVITSIFIIVLYVVFGRKSIKNKLKIPTKSSNVESLIGKRGVVTQEIGSNKAGRVRVGTEIWRAVSDKKMNEKTEVIVKKIDGVTAHVVEYNSVESL